jgi:hypothetical protein
MTALGDDDGGIPLAYLQKLKVSYDRWLDVIAPRMPVVRVPWEEFRPVKDVWEQIQKTVEARTRYARSLLLP